jgi:hypothetical protein
MMMALEPALLAMMTQTVQHAALSGRDAYGAPLYAAASGYAARVVGTHRRLRDAAGSETVARHVAYVAMSGTIGPEDRLTLPDGSTPPVLQVDQFTDETGGVHHTRILFG